MSETTNTTTEGNLNFAQLKDKFALKNPDGPKRFFFQGGKYDLNNISLQTATALAKNPRCSFINEKGAGEKVADAATAAPAAPVIAAPGANDDPNANTSKEPDDKGGKKKS